jgi:hypothetical protein
MSDLMLDVDQAGELKAAFRRGDWTNALIKKACEGDRLAQFRDVLLGRAEIKPIEALKRKINWVSLAPVTSDGRPGQAGICELEKSHYRVDNWAKDVMTKPAYVVTNGKVYKPVVLLGGDFEDNERVTSNIRKVAEEMHFITPPAELARLLRKSVTDTMIEDMGLWALIVMHEPITDSLGYPHLLGVSRVADGQWLRACSGGPGLGWRREGGFVFLAPQE